MKRFYRSSHPAWWVFAFIAVLILFAPREAFCIDPFYEPEGDSGLFGSGTLQSLEAELPNVAGAENIIAISVLFASAGASSLDYAVAVDLKGEAASRGREIRFDIQRIQVDACNENGWEIPFTQITVHQAEGSGV